MQAKKSHADVLDALVVVARAFGVELTSDAIRSSYVSIAQEVPTTTLVSIAHDAGLDARAIRPKWRDLPRLGEVLPAIIRLKDGSAAILESVMTDPQIGQIVAVRSPSDGPDADVVLDEHHFNELWAGEIILIKRRHRFKDEAQPFGLLWLLSQVLREQRLFREIAIASIITTVFALTPAFAMMIIIDRVLVNHSTSTLMVLAGGLSFIILFETALTYLRRMFMEVTATRIDGRLNLYLMQKLLALPMEYFERNATGLIISKLSKIWQVRNFLTGQLFTTLIDLIMLVILVPVLFMLQWRLAIFVFALAGIIFLIIYLFLGPIGKRYEKVINAEQIKNTYLTETVYGMRTIKSLALEGRRQHDWDLHVARSLEARHAYGVMSNYPQTLSLPFERMIYAGSILIGAALSLAYPDVILPGTLMAFGMLAGRTASPLIQSARLLRDLGEVRGAIGEAASIMNHPPEEGRVGSGLRLPVYGNVSFQNVDFRYTTACPSILSLARSSASWAALARVRLPSLGYCRA